MWEAHTPDMPKADSPVTEPSNRVGPTPARAAFPSGPPVGEHGGSQEEGRRRGGCQGNGCAKLPLRATASSATTRQELPRDAGPDEWQQEQCFFILM